jgi:pilus assembly protein CpaE
VVVLNRFDLRGGLSRQQVEQALGFAVDIVIPDLPRLVENAATMGEAMVDGRNAFARAIATLARHTAYTQLIDSPLDPNASEARKPWWRR